MLTEDQNGSKKRIPKNRQLQYKSEPTGHYIAVEAATGIVLDIKKDGKPFKGIKMAKRTRSNISNVQVNNPLPYERVSKLEEVVLEMRNQVIMKKLEAKVSKKKAS